MDLTDEFAEQDAVAAKEFAANVEDAKRRMTGILKKLRRLEREGRSLRATVEPGCDLVFIRETLNSLLVRIDGLWMDVYAAVSCALSWRHSPNEVAAWYQRCCDEGFDHPRVGRSDIEDLMYERKVPNAPLRAKFEELGIASSEMAIRMGMDPQDRSHVLRALGVKPYGTAERGKNLAIYVAYGMAVKMASALGMTPTQAGV